MVHRHATWVSCGRSILFHCRVVQLRSYVRVLYSTSGFAGLSFLSLRASLRSRVSKDRKSVV